MPVPLSGGSSAPHPYQSPVGEDQMPVASPGRRIGGRDTVKQAHALHGIEGSLIWSQAIVDLPYQQASTQIG